MLYPILLDILDIPVVFPGFCRIFCRFSGEINFYGPKNTLGDFTITKDVKQSYMLNGNGVQRDIF